MFKFNVGVGFSFERNFLISCNGAFYYKLLCFAIHSFTIHSDFNIINRFEGDAFHQSNTMADQQLLHQNQQLQQQISLYRYCLLLGIIIVSLFVYLVDSIISMVNIITLVNHFCRLTKQMLLDQ